MKRVVGVFALLNRKTKYTAEVKPDEKPKLKKRREKKEQNVAVVELENSVKRERKRLIKVK